MTTWDEMSPVLFDQTGLTKKQRAIVVTAPETLFPALLPDPPPRGKHAKPAEPQMPGQGDLLGDEDEEAWAWR
ncbi:MAG: hypothetical protein JWO67_4707 [Streptosporangiaceae bacterium]|nr:hypothetical protein [Streptosporangiaceae bacterium]